jgi:hypothetical protein
VSCLLEYLRGHVARRPAGSGKDVKLFLVHYSRQAKVCYQKIGVVFRGSEQEVLGFEITVHNAMIVKVCDCGKSGTNEVGSVRLVIGAFAADTIEQFTTEGEIRDEVYCSRNGQGWSSNPEKGVCGGLGDARLFIVSK